jgi:large conductance mechanosensitive channel
VGPFNYGKLIANVLHFFIVAFVLFLVVKAMNKAKTIIVKDEDDDKADGNVPLL